jgi:4-hydroxy-tetrahydrodipicolinate synthase
MNPSLSGVFAALCTPIDDRGRLDVDTFDRVLEFVLERGVDGIVMGGATAEFPQFSVEDRALLADRAVRRMDKRGRVIVCVGTSSIFSTLQLTRMTVDSGCDALLLPMPYYFRYSQDDLAAYCETVCASVSAPFLLYNLPAFSNPIEVPTAIRLLKTIPNLVGLKDSSGEVTSLAPLAAGRDNSRYSLFVGDDSLLLSALQAGWNGVVSGIACFAPELIAAVYRSYQTGDVQQAVACQATLNEVIQKLVADLPIPWGVRLGLAARGIGNGPMHLPFSQLRRRQIEELHGWLTDWAATRNFNLKIVC